MTPQEFQDTAFEEVLKIGKATSNITRLKILYALFQGKKSVEQLANTIRISVGTTSKNLQILKKINLVKEEKTKNFVFYILASDKVAKIISLLIDLSEENLDKMQDINHDYNHLPSISVLDLKKNVAENKSYIIDLRPKDEYEQGHVPNAHNYPYDNFQDRLPEIPKNQNIILYCRGRLCGISEDIGQQLSKLGYKVTIFNNTVKEWQLANN